MPQDSAAEDVLPSTVRVRKAGGLNTTSVLTAYRRMAPVYNWVFGGVFQHGRRKTIDLLDPQPDERVLEVGVGTGITLRHWPRHARITAIDISPEMLRRAQRTCAKHRLDHVDLRLMNAQAMHFPDNSFDKVAAMYVVSVTPDLSALMREVQRVCVPGGRICIVNHFEQRNRFMRAFERHLSNYAGFLGFDSALPLHRITERKGLSIRSVQRVNVGGYWRLIEAENVK